MSTVDVLTPSGTKAGSAELPESVFDVQVNVPLIHQVVVAQLAAARQGTHDTKSRGEVRGGGRKPYRQKGTGRARQGSTRAPQFAGGGIVHGPTPRDYSQRTPKKMKAAALRGALSDRARNGRVHVVTALVEGETPSTKAAVQALANLSDRQHVLVVVGRGDDVTWLSLRNVGRVHLLTPDQLNTYDVLISDDVVFTEAALAAFVAGPAAAGKSASERRGHERGTGEEPSAADDTTVSAADETEDATDDTAVSASDGTAAADGDIAGTDAQDSGTETETEGSEK